MGLESRTRAEFLNVQALRGIAASMVAVDHLAQYELQLTPSPHFLLWFKWIGPTGVDLFFAISGFIMLVTNFRAFGEPDAPRYFLSRRIIRIFPVYWFVTLVAVAAAIRLHGLHGVYFTPFFVLATILLLPRSVPPPVQPAWSLIFEMFFYYWFAIGLHFRRAIFYGIFAISVAIVVIGNLATHHGGASVASHTIFSPFNLEFALGILVATAVCYKRLPPTRLIVAAAGIALVIGLAFLTLRHGGYEGAPHGGWLRFSAAGLPFALVVFAAVVLEIRGRAIRPGLLTFMGDASYSLYLWHVLLIGLYIRVFGRVPHHGLAGHIVFIVLVLAATIATALGLYVAIERPLTETLKRRLSVHRRRTRPAIAGT